MSLARHHIIANSTFSWWGAWLGHRPGQSVIAPSVWASDKVDSTRDRYPVTWTTLNGAGEVVPLSLS